MSGKTTTLLKEYTAIAGITRSEAKSTWNAMDWRERTAKRKQLKSWVKFIEGYAAMQNIPKGDARKICVGMNDSERSGKLQEVKGWIKNAEGFAQAIDFKNDIARINVQVKPAKALNAVKSDNSRKRLVSHVVIKDGGHWVHESQEK